MKRSSLTALWIASLALGTSVALADGLADQSAELPPRDTALAPIADHAPLTPKHEPAPPPTEPETPLPDRAPGVGTKPTIDDDTITDRTPIEPKYEPGPPTEPPTEPSGGLPDRMPLEPKGPQYPQYLGDCDGDRYVGLCDLTMIMNRWGTCPLDRKYCPEDFNSDGFIGLFDVTCVLTHWGTQY